jgi:brefeldin A-inhibited guanine nucleotide-exchange protein
LLAAVTSPTCAIHEGRLLVALRTTYTIFMNTRTAASQVMVQGTLNQMINSVYGKLNNAFLTNEKDFASLRTLRSNSLENISSSFPEFDSSVTRISRATEEKDVDPPGKETESLPKSDSQEEEAKSVRSSQSRKESHSEEVDNVLSNVLGRNKSIDKIAEPVKKEAPAESKTGGKYGYCIGKRTSKS